MTLQDQNTTQPPTKPLTEVPRDWQGRKGVRLGLPIDRLLSRCVEIDGCWIYTWRLDRKGYVRIRGEDDRKQFGHRLTYEYFIGTIPGSLTYDHLCRTKPCVNPWHGELVTVSVNVARATESLSYANRQKTHCPQGHPLSGENLRSAALSRATGAERVCRTCAAAANRRYRARKASA